MEIPFNTGLQHTNWFMMGHFHDHKEKKTLEKEPPRSRIPRPVSLAFRLKTKRSLQPEMRRLEEEHKDCDISSEQHSKRTISPNSFSSDDTGCPSSQSVSPTKTLSGSENSPVGSPSLGERKAKAKRVRVDVMAPLDSPPPRHKREQHKSTRAPGSDADFSSSSSIGSLKTRESLPNSAPPGKKSSFSRSRSVHIRSAPVFKPAGSPTTLRDSALYAPYRAPPKDQFSSNSSSNSSPRYRRTALSRYHSCSDNHGIKPPNPEQYLTPLQQKEVAIRHLRSKLKESENVVHDRDGEIEELKAQLGRMREDWIEEECHRVEAQLALKEARKEIKQLRQVVETMKNSLMEKDKGIQKYFIDINIQNRKLESLLHSMEVAQSGSALQDEPTLDYISDLPERTSSDKLEEEAHLVNQATRDLTDSGLLVSDEMSNQTDTMEQVFMSTAVDCSQNPGGKLLAHAGISTLVHSFLEENILNQPKAPDPSVPTTEHSSPEEKGVQTEDALNISDLQSLLLQLLNLQKCGITGSNISTNSFPQPAAPAKMTDFAATNSQPIPKRSRDSGQYCLERSSSPHLKEELGSGDHDESSKVPENNMLVGKRYWSSSFLVDLVAVAAPVLPTVAWLYSRHGIDGGAPVYNIAALVRGCCVMGLHSLRNVTHGVET
ncbi:syntabulin isoform X2 [Denticeps clupeoides]|uniref:SYBU protein n=1 Tax=Denticeps clupeoides TaxID=299321 RepID=A0AAY4E9T3_9TELE|nr:syntabulin isoform X2 [Denticeps clupeoides]